MTPQEQELLQGLLGRVNGTELHGKDEDAERMLRTGLGGNPNALYILCQTVLAQQFALDTTQRDLMGARSELEQLRQQSSRPQEHGSFLGNLFGMGKSDAPPAPAQQINPNPGGNCTPVNNPGGPGYGNAPVQSAGYGYGPPSGYGQPTGYNTGMPSGAGGMFGGGGGFLQGAMQTAAGVVAGEFAFRAIEDVFRGFGGGGESRGFSDSDAMRSDTLTDNSDNGGFGDRLRDADGLGSGISPDIEDRRGDSSGFFGGGGSDYDGNNDDSSAFTDGSSDNSGFGGDDGGNNDGF